VKNSRPCSEFDRPFHPILLRAMLYCSSTMVRTLKEDSRGARRTTKRWILVALESDHAITMELSDTCDLSHTESKECGRQAQRVPAHLELSTLRCARPYWTSATPMVCLTLVTCAPWTNDFLTKVERASTSFTILVMKAEFHYSSHWSTQDHATLSTASLVSF
jgi:hypothetical protein